MILKILLIFYGEMVLHCKETEDGSKDANGEKPQNGRSAVETSDDSVKRYRSLLDDSSVLEGRSQAYITYRSCIPAVNEEKLSVLGFEDVHCITRKESMTDDSFQICCHVEQA